MATGGGSRYVGPTVQATIREQASATASDHDGTSARREAVTAGLVAAGDWVSVIAVVPGRKWWLRSKSQRDCRQRQQVGEDVGRGNSLEDPAMTAPQETTEKAGGGEKG